MKLATVKGRFLAVLADSPIDEDSIPEQIPLKGTVILTPSVPAILDTSGEVPATLLPTPITAVLDEQGDISLNGTKGVQVAATMGEGVNPSGWTYKVAFNLQADKLKINYASYDIQLPPDEVTDLTLVAKVPTSTGVGVTRGIGVQSVTSANGVLTFRLTDASTQDVAIEGALVTSIDGMSGPVSKEQLVTSLAEDFAGTEDFEATRAALTPSKGGRPVGKGELVYSVMDYGAVGDGVTDDTTAVQAALDAIPEHSTLIFPGQHLITTVTLDKRYVTLRGPGTIYQGKVVIGSTTTRRDLYWAIEGLSFERSAIDADTYAVELLKVRRGRIEGCTFMNFDKAIYVRPLTDAAVHDTAMVKIKGNEFDRVRYAVYVDRAPAATWMHSSDWKFIGNTINLALVTAFHAFSIDGLVLADNVFFFPNYATTNATSKAEKMHNVYIGESDWIVVKGNNMFESGIEALHLDKPKHFNISDNLIAWPGQRVATDAIKISGNSTMHGVITDNVISRFTGNAVGYYNTGSGIVAVKNNVFEYDATAASYYGAPALSTLPHYGVFQATNSGGLVIDSGNEATGGIYGNRRGSQVSTTHLSQNSAIGASRAVLAITAGTSNVPVFSLASASMRSTTTYSGLLLVEVKHIETESANTASYLFHVSKHALGVNLTKISEHGLLTGGSASWPSFSWDLATDGKLIATPVGSTAGTFYFTATTQGNLVALGA